MPAVDGEGASGRGYVSVPYRLFISHSANDGWLARQIARCAAERGAEPFLDTSAFETGDDIDPGLKNALLAADELVVILSPEALDRPYIWIEIGVVWSE